MSHTSDHTKTTLVSEFLKCLFSFLSQNLVLRSPKSIRQKILLCGIQFLSVYDKLEGRNLSLSMKLHLSITGNLILRFIANHEDYLSWEPKLAYFSKLSGHWHLQSRCFNESYINSNKIHIFRYFFPWGVWLQSIPSLHPCSPFSLRL